MGKGSQNIHVLSQGNNTQRLHYKDKLHRSINYNRCSMHNTPTDYSDDYEVLPIINNVANPRRFATCSVLLREGPDWRGVLQSAAGTPLYVLLLRSPQLHSRVNPAHLQELLRTMDFFVPVADVSVESGE